MSRASSAGRRNGQALSPLGAASLEHEPPVFRAHAHEEPVRALPVPPIRLIRPLHDDASLSRKGRNPNTSEAGRVLSIQARKIRAFVTLENAMLQSVPRARLGQPPKFSTGVEKNVEKPGGEGRKALVTGAEK
jgi:hypothetical protein